MVVTSHYDTSGRPSKEVLTNSLFVSPQALSLSPAMSRPSPSHQHPEPNKR